MSRAARAALMVAELTLIALALTVVGLPRTIKRTRAVPAGLSCARIPTTAVSAAIAAVARSFSTVPAGRAAATVQVT